MHNRIAAKARSFAEPFLRLSRAKKPSGQFASGAPSAQNVADIFTGEWSSTLPGLSVMPGHADLFHDDRITWMDKLFEIKGKSVLELGPLEGAHTKMMTDFGAASITAVEGNQRAFLKCLCVKELYGMRDAQILLGDFMRFFESSSQRFDIIVASGVLYHLSNPLDLLENMTVAADRVFVWTHYYDGDAINRRRDKNLFGSPQQIEHHGSPYTAVSKAYASRAIKWSGFSGGMDQTATWLTRDSLVGFFKNRGFSVEIGFDDADHRNGPAIAICASR
ncbi:class I SAM-dependent methyltransferase [Tardiphaga sp. vice304]|uniref:class I SAM-dependent methyltransferase n=1 Tax=Tardiphaga sp. vice304 TaxID=2592817 RepID=UPI0011643FCB|nr:methyltransferase domain-containing protein [Tardiphaga sp. vice304]QDM28187.1 class I SAM-dependent methyltransferase [Tardiphaga sp. vice304]